MYLQPKISLRKIPKGYPGTLKTLEYIVDLIKRGAKDFCVRQKAIDILLQRGVRPKDYLGEIEALFEWVQNDIRYTKDPFRVEVVLHTARRMLELRAGDCDDMSILLGSMLESIGHQVRLVVSGPDPLQPRLFTHIYLQVYHKGRWISLDATMPHPMGWSPRALVKKIFPIERRPNMISEDMELQGTFGAVAAVPDWLQGLIRAVRSEAIKPKDTRVKSLWDLLRQKQLLSRSPRLKALLRRIWDRGLAARPRPRTTQRLKRRLRNLGILPPSTRQTAQRPLSPVTTTMQPVTLRPVQPVQVKAVAATTKRP